MSKQPRTTTDGLEILDRKHFRGRPKRQAALAEARLNAEIAQEIYAPADESRAHPEAARRPRRHCPFSHFSPGRR